MHKIFAKPLFLGKKVIFLTECHSTNDELSNLTKIERVEEGTLVVSDHQKSGRGQRGNVWLDEPGKNVLMSVLIKPTYLSINEQHFLNIVIGLGALKTVSRHLPESSIKLKWPNDVLVNGKKISGILVENSVKSSKLENSVIGIGLNLNQRAFGLPSATSMSLETDHEFGRDEFIEEMLVDIEFYLLKLKNGQKDMLMQLYHEKLYLKGEVAEFRDQDGQFSGMILGIDHIGKLIVSKNGGMVNYGVKEIEFLEV